MLVRIHVYVGTRISSDSACSFTTVAAISVLFGETHDAPRCDPGEALEACINRFFECWLEIQLAPAQGASRQATSEREIPSNLPADYDFSSTTLSARPATDDA